MTNSFSARYIQRLFQFPISTNVRLHQILDMTPVKNACSETKLEDCHSLLYSWRNSRQMLLFIFAFKKVRKRRLSQISRILKDFKFLELFQKNKRIFEIIFEAFLKFEEMFLLMKQC